MGADLWDPHGHLWALGVERRGAHGCIVFVLYWSREIRSQHIHACAGPDLSGYLWSREMRPQCIHGWAARTLVGIYGQELCIHKVNKEKRLGH